MSSDARASLRTAILDPQRVLEVPNAPQQPLRQHFVGKGLLEISADSAIGNSSSHSTLPQHQAMSVSQQIHSQLNSLSHKRTLASLPTPAQPNPKKRKIRTCKKCGKESCNGRKEVKLCLDQCRDCGKSVCNGRDSKRPNKPCWDVD